MTPKQLLKYCGNKKRAADCANVEVQTFEIWYESTQKIPIKQQAYIQLATAGELKATGIKRWRR